MLLLQLRRDEQGLRDRVYLYRMPPSGRREDLQEEDLLGFMCLSAGGNSTCADIGLQFGREILVLRGDVRERILQERQ